MVLIASAVGSVCQTPGPTLFNPQYLYMTHRENRAIMRHFNRIDLTHTLAWRLEKPDSCIYCGEALTEATRTKEHLIPQRILTRYRADHATRSLVGSCNVVPCCKYCNELKGSLSLTEWRAFLQTYRKRPIEKRYQILCRLRYVIRTKH